MRCKYCGCEFERPMTTGDGWNDPVVSISPCCWGDYWETEEEYKGSFAAEYALMSVPNCEGASYIRDLIEAAYVAGAEGLDPYALSYNNWGKRP